MRGGVVIEDGDRLEDGAVLLEHEADRLDAAVSGAQDDDSARASCTGAGTRSDHSQENPPRHQMKHERQRARRRNGPHGHEAIAEEERSGHENGGDQRIGEQQPRDRVDRDETGTIRR